MTPTATRTRAEADPLDRLKEAHLQLDEARQERARLGEEARAFHTELQRADATLAHLARTSPDQFADGHPRPGTEAASLRAKLDQAQSSKWPDIIAGADQRVAECEDHVRRLTDENAVELATREYRAGEDDLTKLDELAEQLLALLSGLAGRGTRLMQIAASCGGRIDGRDIALDDRLEHLRGLLANHDEFHPPRSRTLTPLVGETPRVWRGREGGWVLGAHGSDSLADEQPTRLEPKR